MGLSDQNGGGLLDAMPVSGLFTAWLDYFQQKWDAFWTGVVAWWDYLTHLALIGFYVLLAVLIVTVVVVIAYKLRGIATRVMRRFMMPRMDD